MPLPIVEKFEKETPVSESARTILESATLRVDTLMGGRTKVGRLAYQGWTHELVSILLEEGIRFGGQALYLSPTRQDPTPSTFALVRNPLTLFQSLRLLTDTLLWLLDTASFWPVFWTCAP